MVEPDVAMEFDPFGEKGRFFAKNGSCREPVPGRACDRPVAQRRAQY
jgi:hypothetical protein